MVLKVKKVGSGGACDYGFLRKKSVSPALDTGTIQELTGRICTSSRS